MRHETFAGFDFAIFSSDPQKKVPTKYVFLLHVLDKNESFQYWVLGTFWKSQKLIPSKKNQSALIAKISSRKTQKIANSQK